VRAQRGSDPAAIDRGGIGRTAGVLAGLLALLAGLLPGMVDVAPAAAAAGDPIRERGVVSRVIDGDTIDVRVDGRTSDTRIRLSGIQAFEFGECGYDIATDRLTELVQGERVELRARQASSSSLGRPIRSVHLPLASGGTADINRLMLLEGMGLWFPIEPEITDTASYNVAATHARRLGRGIWDEGLCGAGPQAGHPMELWVKSDADGVDNDNLNDEYVRIVNRHPSTTLDLGGWLLRESSQFRFDPREEGFRFPTGTSVAPGSFITVRVGSGTNTATTFHMGSPEPLFDNADRSLGTDDQPATNRGMGDGVYLLDTRGNVRSSFTWPCVVDCSTPLAGNLKISHVEYDPPGVDTADNEYVELTNVGNARISLDGYQLRNIFVFHEFRFGTYLDAGETLRVTVGSGTSSRLQQYWGQPGPILANGGDRVDVVSFDERFVDCVDWGTGRSCPWPVTVPGVGTTGALPTAPELAGSEPVDPGPFPDVPADGTHTAAIEWLVEQGITTGCGGGLFCPGDPVSREQMATFLLRALDLAASDGSSFADVNAGSTHEPAIGALRDAQITTGCGGGRFCPGDPVSREQMATFLLRALELTPGDGSTFRDVTAGTTHEPAIGALRDAAITTGCGNGNYCPSRSVSREQMATFLRNALDG
jgi:endonuclease YncB( thermonuclease family)